MSSKPTEDGGTSRRDFLIPSTTSEWFRDWKSPVANEVRTFYPPYYEQLAALKRAPEYHQPKGLTDPRKQ